MTGPFTATPDLGTPFKVQSEPYALAAAVVTAGSPVPGPSAKQSGNGTAKTIVIALTVIVAAALAFTYRKRPAR